MFSIIRKLDKLAKDPRAGLTSKKDKKKKKHSRDDSSDSDSDGKFNHLRKCPDGFTDVYCDLAAYMYIYIYRLS